MPCSRYTGYGFGLQYGGPHEDEVKRVGDYIDTFISAIDAIDYRSRMNLRFLLLNSFRQIGANIQYSKQAMLREVHKAYVGFNFPQPTTIPICTV